MNTAINKIESFALPKASNVRPVVLASLGILAVLVATYMYFVGKIVFDVVARRHAEASIRSTKSSVSSLEASYFEEMKGLDLDRAVALGLSESHNALYASRDTSVGFLSVH